MITNLSAWDDMIDAAAKMRAQMGALRERLEQCAPDRHAIDLHESADRPQDVHHQPITANDQNAT
jgi:hypothetical protein